MGFIIVFFFSILIFIYIWVCYFTIIIF